MYSWNWRRTRANKCWISVLLCGFHVANYYYHYYRNHFWGAWSESRHLRGSIRCPGKRKHGFQCSPGIDGGVEQQKYWISILSCGFYIINYVLLPRPLLGPFSESRHLRGSIKRDVLKKHGFQCSPGNDGGVEQQNIEFHFLSLLYIIAAITSGSL